MEEEFVLLKNPFEKIEKGNVANFQDKCLEIAERLFKEYCIQCGEKKYYFAEIEFYYYDKDNFNQKWNEKTYPRTDKDAGTLFFHYSGVDICFDSKFSKGKFGGILIRSLKVEDNETKFITGPSVCMLELLNVCVEQKALLPELKEDNGNKGCEVCKKPIERYGIRYKEKEKELKDVPLCFFDQKLFEKYKSNNNKETFKNAKWDYGRDKNGIIKGETNLVRYYHRFDNVNNK